MIDIEFIVPQPNNEIAYGSLPAVPRKGELLVLNERTFVVLAVIWNVEQGRVVVELREL